MAGFEQIPRDESIKTVSVEQLAGLLDVVSFALDPGVPIRKQVLYRQRDERTGRPLEARVSMNAYLVCLARVDTGRRPVHEDNRALQAESWAGRSSNMYWSKQGPSTTWPPEECYDHVAAELLRGDSSRRVPGDSTNAQIALSEQHLTDQFFHKHDHTFTPESRALRGTWQLAVTAPDGRIVAANSDGDIDLRYKGEAETVEHKTVEIASAAAEALLPEVMHPALKEVVEQALA